MVQTASEEESAEIMSSGEYVCCECPGYVDVSVDCGH